MSKDVEKLAAAGHLTPEQVHRIGIRVARIVKLAQEDPEFRKEAMEKLALQNPTLNRALKLLAGGAVAGMGVTGGVKAIDMISNKIQAHNDSINKAKFYKEMLDANPDLKESGVDARMVQRNFDTLHKFNPEYASDPMVAGAYVHNSMAYARPNIDMLNNVVKARSSIMQSQRSAAPSHGEQAAKILGKATSKFMGE